MLAAASLGAFVAFLDATIVNIAFPSIQAGLGHVSRSDVSWVLNGYNVVFAALLVPAGTIADRLGRKRMFMVGVATFGTASLLCAAAPSTEVLVAVRLLQAAGAALLVPTSLGLLLDEYPPGERVQAIAVLGAVAALAAASGPVFGGLLVHAFSWRAVFVVNVPICAVTLAIAAAAVRVRRDPSGGRLPDVVGIAMFAGAMALLALGLTREDVWGWLDIRVVGSLALGVVLLTGFVARSRRHPAPAIDLSLLAGRTVRAANLAVVVFAAAFYAKILIDVLFLTSIWHYSVLYAGAAMTPGPLITTVLATPAGRLVGRFGAGPVAAAGAGIYAVGCAWYALRTGGTPHYLTEWLPGTAFTGAGIALAFPTLTSAAVTTLPVGRYATGSALNATARQLGGVLGIAIAISIIGSVSTGVTQTAFVRAWTYAAISAAIAAVIALTLGTRRNLVSEAA